MGLDMYLYAEKFCPLQNWGSGEENKNFDKVVDILQADKFVEKTDSFVSAYVRMQIAYWHKANAIHHYFIQNCAGGIDDCKPVHVYRENFEELLKICNELMESKDVEKAKELLPTQSGFFFGPTDYDTYYFDDLEYTQKILTKILKEAPDDWDFVYRASW